MHKMYTYIGLAGDQHRIAELFPVAPAGVASCGDCTVGGSRDTDHRWTCTRPAAHVGLHVAHSGTAAVAIWCPAAIIVNK